MLAVYPAALAGAVKHDQPTPTTGLRPDGQAVYLVNRLEVAVFVDRAHGHRRLGDAQEEVVRTPA